LILLDTNVVSALMLTVPDARITAWLDVQPRNSVWTTSVTLYEIQFGIALLEPGRKQLDLREKLQRMLTIIKNRILPFDAAAATEASAVAARQRRAGRSVEVRDVQIAGIALATQSVLATRNTRHFNGTGASLVDPWAESS